MAFRYVIRIERGYTRVGQENPYVRIVKPDDLQMVLDEEANPCDEIEIKKIRELEE